MSTSGEVETLLAAARTRWPAGPEPDDEVRALIAARAADGTPRVDDIYLAWWCRTGAAPAITAFEQTYAEELKALTTQFRQLQADELRQILRIKLFVGTPEQPAKIRDFTGTGSLKSWLRVTAVRLFIDQMRSTRVQRESKDVDDFEMLGAMTDAQGRQISADLAGKVKTAFAAAVAGLAPKQRVFLRHAYVDHHTLDQIAAHYSVHRTTVARVLAAARQQLVEQTRAALLDKAGIGTDELTSVIRMLDSRIDLSLSRVFQHE